LGDDFFFQSGAVFLAICYIFDAKISDLRYLLHFGATISDVRAICCVFELKYLILHAICSISELKSQIWVAKNVNLHDN
jgi:hypothetical protein